MLFRSRARWRCRDGGGPGRRGNPRQAAGTARRRPRPGPFLHSRVLLMGALLSGAGRHARIAKRLARRPGDPQAPGGARGPCPVSPGPSARSAATRSLRITLRSGPGVRARSRLKPLLTIKRARSRLGARRQVPAWPSGMARYRRRPAPPARHAGQRGRADRAESKTSPILQNECGLPPAAPSPAARPAVAVSAGLRGAPDTVTWSPAALRRLAGTGKVQVPEETFRETAGPANHLFGVRQGLEPILHV